MKKEVKNGNLKGAGFHRNPENINRKGRPRTSINIFLAEMKAAGVKHVTKNDIFNAYQAMLGASEAELVRVINDTTASMILRIVGKQMLDKKGGHEMIERMLDRTHGRAVQTTTVQGESDKPLEIIIKKSGSK